MLDIDRIKHLVEKSGMSKKQFSKEIGMTEQSFYEMLRRGSTKLGTVDKMAKILRVSRESLYEGQALVKVEPSTQNIEYVPIHAQAGFFSGFGQEAVEPKKFSIPELPEGKYFAFTVSGESMAPTIRSGDIVVCLKLTDATEIRPNAVHVLFDKTEGLVVKRLEVKDKKIRCVSDNPDYPPYEIEATSVKDIYRVRRVITSNI